MPQNRPVTPTTDPLESPSPQPALSPATLRGDLGGALGDLGTLLPFLVGFIVLAGVHPTSILLAFGLSLIAVGWGLGIPFPVQPMKAVGAAALASAACCARGRCCQHRRRHDHHQALPVARAALAALRAHDVAARLGGAVGGAAMVDQLSVGQSVALRSTTTSERTWNGKVTRINGMVNSGTQTITVFIEVSGEGLDEGMFLEASVAAKPAEHAFEIERSVIFDENQVYVVQDSVLVQKTIEPLHFKDRTVIVRGLEDKQLVLSRMAPGSFPGMKVTVQKD